MKSTASITPPVALAILLATSIGVAEDTASRLLVTFHLHAPELSSDTSVYLAGNLPELGNWHPGKIRMESVGDHRWTYQIRCQAKQNIQYKYTLGAWATEAADAEGQPLPNFSVTVEQATTVRDKVLHWTSGRPKELHGQITGEVRYHKQLKGPEILPRDVLVWLPPGYADSQKRYPVLYMHDGQNLVDPATSAFGVDWQVDETCTRLIAEKRIPPLIIVGIYNTRDRSHEYTTGQKGRAYRDFVVEVLKPLVDTKYRTKPSREHTLVGGSSAGGLCAFMLAWERNEVFSKALCFSPALRVAGESDSTRLDYVSVVEQSPPPKHPLFFYLDCGGDSLEQKLQPGIDAMASALRKKGFEPEKDFLALRDAEAKHTEAAWAKRFPQALQKAFAVPREATQK